MTESVLGVTFYWVSRTDPRGTSRDVEYVRIQIPGDKLCVVDRPATDLDRRTYAKQYEAFKAGRYSQTVGTPLVALPGLGRWRVEELNEIGVRTCEQLAEIPDGNMTIAGLHELKRQAREFLATAKAAAPLDAALRAVQERDVEIESLRRQLAAMGSK